MCGGGMLQSGIRGMQQDREALKEFSLLVTICLLAYVFRLEEEVCCRCYSLFFHYGSSVSFLECTWQKNWEHG
jgi:hypothetical protein